MKKTVLYTIICMAAAVAVSCASTKKTPAQTDGAQNGGAAGEAAAQSASGAAQKDDAVTQNAVLASDGTVAEVVPHVEKNATGESAQAEQTSDTAGAAAVQKAQPKKETPEEKAARKLAEKTKKEEAKKAADLKKAAEKAEQQKKKDNYTGWVYIPKKNFTISNGDVQVSMRGSTGSFELYAIPETGKPIPLLATYDEFCSTFFSLMIGRKEYRLNREAGVQSEARKTEYGAQMAYTIPKKAQIVIDFSFMPSIATSSRVDMLRITVYTINLGKSTQAFTVKGVFDTMLGENTVSHFSTAAHRRINNEVQYTDMSVEKWVRSENQRASIQFLLCGKGITEPKSVTLGNKDNLSTTTWLPSAQETRSFSSVLAYNNSALGVNWKTAYLDPLKTDVITFYISVAADGNEPAGKDFLASLAAGRTALPSNMPNTVQTTSVAPEPASVTAEETASPYHANMPAVAGDTGTVLDTDAPDAASQYVPPAPSTVQSPAPVSSGMTALPATPAQSDASAKTPLATVQENKPYRGTYPLSSVTKEQLDPEYIQNLLDRIADLESDPALVDKAEVKQLNDELDAILAVIRSGN